MKSLAKYLVRMGGDVMIGSDGRDSYVTLRFDQFEQAKALYLRILSDAADFANGEARRPQGQLEDTDGSGSLHQ